jgi:hypothetical protein
MSVSTEGFAFFWWASQFADHDAGWGCDGCRFEWDERQGVPFERRR